VVKFQCNKTIKILPRWWH